MAGIPFEQTPKDSTQTREGARFTLSRSTLWPNTTQGSPLYYGTRNDYRNGFGWEKRQILSQRLEGWRVKHILGVCATLLNSKWVFKSKSFRINHTIRLQTRMTPPPPPRIQFLKMGENIYYSFLKENSVKASYSPFQMRAGYNLYCFDIMTILFKINLPASELSKRLKTEK